MRSLFKNRSAASSTLFSTWRGRRWRCLVAAAVPLLFLQTPVHWIRRYFCDVQKFAAAIPDPEASRWGPDPPDRPELERLYWLARSPWEVKEALFLELLEYPVGEHRLEDRLDYLYQAIVGMDPDFSRRKRLLALAHSRPFTGENQIAAGMWATRIVSSAPGDLRLFSQVTGNGTGADLRAAMGAGIFSSYLWYPGATQEGLSGKLDADSAAALSGHICKIISTRSDRWRLFGVDVALTNFATKLESPAASALAGNIVKALESPGRPVPWGACSITLAALTERLDAASSAAVADYLVRALHSAPDFQWVDYFEKALPVLAGKVEARRALALTESLVEAMSREPREYRVAAMGEAVAAMAEKLEHAAAAKAGEKLRAISTMKPVLRWCHALGEALPALASPSASGAALPGAETLLEDIKQSKRSSFSEWPLYQALARLASKLDSAASLALTEKVIEAVREKKFSVEVDRHWGYTTSTLGGRVLTALAKNLDAAAASALLERLVEDPATEKNSYEERDVFRIVIPNLTGKPEAGPAFALAEKLVQKMCEGTNHARWGTFEEVLAFVAGKLEEKTASRLAEKLVSKKGLEGNAFVDLMAPLDAKALAYLAEKLLTLPPPVAEPVKSRNSAMPGYSDLPKLLLSVLARRPNARKALLDRFKTLGYNSATAWMQSSVRKWPALLARVDASLVPALARLMVPVIGTGADRDPDAPEARIFAALAEPLDAAQTAELAQQLVKATSAEVNAQNGVKRRKALGAALKSMVEKLDGPAVSRIAEGLVNAMITTSDPDRLAAQGDALVTLKVPADATALSEAVALLKHPLISFRPCFISPIPIWGDHSVLTSVLIFLGQSFRGEPFPDLQSFVTWALAHRPDHDLESPPALPKDMGEG